MPTTTPTLFEPLARFATEVATKFAVFTPNSGEPEEQLRAPLEVFMREVGELLGRTVVAQGEVRLPGIGKPDFAVYSNGTLCGYIEVKQPGKGANTSRFTGHDKQQWERFRNIPNILYTDGNDWGLYQNGESAGEIVRLSGDIVSQGNVAVAEQNAAALELLLRDFLAWAPIVPANAQDLAKLLAPLCRLLRQEVEEALQNTESPFQLLYREWQETLFANQSSDRFADAYAQTVTFALLLANASAGDVSDLRQAEQNLEAEHALLGKALKIFTDNLRPAEIPLSINILQRIVAAVPQAGWRDTDPWLYFYEDFLAEYDPELRKNTGSYYTPVEVVHVMTCLVESILIERMGKMQGFATPGVMTLDPAVGTGTFLLGIAARTLERVTNSMGAGAACNFAETLGRQLFGFERQVGPYAVAQLRLSRALNESGAHLPADGPNIFLTDTLESPNLAPEFPSLLTRELTEQHRRAIAVKNATPVLVCIGNPPYDRHPAGNAANRRESGSWVRWGEENRSPDDQAPPLLDSFSAPVRQAGQGGQLKNLYNLYVYFWRWALWKVFEQGDRTSPGIVAYITASSFLEGPAFLGMREIMRRQCDEIWIIDLGGDGRGSRREENIFNIQTPVCITLAVRYGESNTEAPAIVHYARIQGSRAEKFAALRNIQHFDSLNWEDCPSEWQARMIPQGQGRYFSFPLLQDIFPWQHSGVKAGRTWVVAPDSNILQKRWTRLFQTEDEIERRALFKDAPPSTGGCTIERTPRALHSNATLEAVCCPGTRQFERIVSYGFRSFDRHSILADARCLDRPGPTLWASNSAHQLFFVTLTSAALNIGPAIMVSPVVPDLHYFRGSYGAKDVMPLYRDAAATQPNLVPGLLDLLAQTYGAPVVAEDVACYVYAVLAHNHFTSRFHEELGKRECRVPFTREAGLFTRGVNLGRQLVWLHSFGERFIPQGGILGSIPQGTARCTVAVPGDLAGYPESFSYNETTQTLHVGAGAFAPVAPEVYTFEVSGLKVVQSWLGYRMKKRSGRTSSPLDDIGPDGWTAAHTEELIKLLWILEATLALYPQMETLLDDILDGPLFEAQDFPAVPDAARKAPQQARRNSRQAAQAINLPGLDT